MLLQRAVVSFGGLFGNKNTLNTLLKATPTVGSECFSESISSRSIEDYLSENFRCFSSYRPSSQVGPSKKLALEYPQFRHLSSAAQGDGEQGKKENSNTEESASEAKEQEASLEGKSEGSEAAGTSVAELEAMLEKQSNDLEAAQAQVQQLTDSVKRSLAEMENVRARAAREMDNAKKYAIQGFVKNILDVVDNLERASGAVPKDALSEEEGKALDAVRLRQLLKGLQEGVSVTESILLQVLRQAGVTRFDPENQAFNPNYHNALFEMADPAKEPGTVGCVTKRGYMLHDRIVRPAEVGVIKGEAGGEQS